MQLLYPIGLLALAGLIIPVLLHLWSVKKGKTLKIGSIYLLGKSANATSKSLKITDWLLFVMRCLLLIIIAFLIAQPLLQKKLKNNRDMGWILIDQNNFSAIYPNHKKIIDSLLNLGFELHDFNIDFNKYELKDSLQKTRKSSVGYTSLLNKLNSTIPNGYSAYLFAPKRVSYIEGDFPIISFKFKWFETNTTDTLKTWTTNYLGKNYVAKSTPKLTSYTNESALDLSPLTVMFFEPKGNDSKYIKAALSAIADYTKRKIVINDFKADLQADITFWFDEEQIPTTYLAKLKPGAKVFSYVNGKASAVNSTVQLSSTEIANIGLYQKIEIEKQGGEAIWKDGFGEPLLIKQQNNQINNYYFYSKFNPQWTDLVWNEEIVSALMPIILGNEKALDFGFEINENDQRVVASNQNLYFNNATNNTKITNVENITITNYLWIFAFVILTLERILSFRKTKVNDKN